jgi:AcrR family transcriptional regulator
MPRTATPTRERIVAAASKLFYGTGIRAVSVDAVAEKAGVTKRTLYYHFASKDELVAAYLEARDQPNHQQFQRWFGEAQGELPMRVRAIFDQLALRIRHPRWKGCGFLRTSAELANLPGHPAMRIGRAHKKRFETWLTETLSMAGAPQPALLARQVALLLDGAFTAVLLHRDPAYMEAAGAAVFTLVETALRPEAGGAAAHVPGINGGNGQGLVEPIGIEPTTSTVQTSRSPS